MLNYKKYAKSRTDRNKAKTAALIRREQYKTGTQKQVQSNAERSARK